MYVLTSTIKGVTTVIAGCEKMGMLQEIARQDLRDVLANNREVYSEDRLSLAVGLDDWAMVYDEDSNSEIAYVIVDLCIVA